MLDTNARKYFQPVFSKLAGNLFAWGVTPNVVTAAAFILGLGCAAAFYAKAYWLALALLWLSGLADVLDGSLARLGGSGSLFGGFLDLISDRIVEMALIVAVALTFPEARLVAVFLLCSIIFSFSIFLASGALIQKTSNKVFYYQAGLAERTETFLVFSLVILLPEASAMIFYVFTAMIIFTGIQRFCEVYGYFHQERDKE